MNRTLKIGILLFCMGLPLWNTFSYAEVEKGILTFGEVHPYPDEAKARILPVAEYVVRHLNIPGILKAKSIVTDNTDQMLTLIKEKKVDIFIDTLHPIVNMKKKGVQLEPILRRWKKGTSESPGVFIARKNNDEINTLDDLVGRTLAFKTVHATPSHLIPRAYLLKRGYNLNYSTVDNPEAINCLFATDYHAIEDLVLKGDVDAGATSGHRIELLVPEVKEKLKIIAKTPKYPFHLVSVAPHVPSDLADNIKKILATMDKEPKARLILLRYYQTTRFDEIPGNISDIIEDLQGFCDPELHKAKDLRIAGGSKRTLVIGRVSDNPKKHYKRLKPMVDYAASFLKDFGIVQGSVLMAKDNQELIRYLKEGKVDWVTETPFSAIIFSEEAGAEIMLRRWKKGFPDYYSVFFVRKDSGINTVADLKGKKIAFEDAGSTTAYFVPLAVIKKEGLDTIGLSSPRMKAPADKLGYVFSKGELNTTVWVHKGLVDAGAYSNLDWEDPNDTPGVFKKDLKIIHQTRPFPRAVELVRKDLDPGIKKKLKEILLSVHKDPEAKVALEAYDRTNKFDKFEGEAIKGLEVSRRLLDYLREELR